VVSRDRVVRVEEDAGWRVDPSPMPFVAAPTSEVLGPGRSAYRNIMIGVNSFTVGIGARGQVTGVMGLSEEGPFLLNGKIQLTSIADHPVGSALLVSGAWAADEWAQLLGGVVTVGSRRASFSTTAFLVNFEGEQGVLVTAAADVQVLPSAKLFIEYTGGGDLDEPDEELLEGFFMGGMRIFGSTKALNFGVVILRDPDVDTRVLPVFSASFDF